MRNSFYLAFAALLLCAACGESANDRRLEADHDTQAQGPTITATAPGVTPSLTDETSTTNPALDPNTPPGQGVDHPQTPNAPSNTTP